MGECPIHDREMDTVERYGMTLETCAQCKAESVSRLMEARR